MGTQGKPLRDLNGGRKPASPQPRPGAGQSTAARGKSRCEDADELALLEEQDEGQHDWSVVSGL